MSHIQHNIASHTILSSRSDTASNDNVKQELTSALFKMYFTSDAKYPLDFSYKLAEAKNKPDLVVANFRQ